MNTMELRVELETVRKLLRSFYIGESKLTMVEFINLIGLEYSIMCSLIHRYDSIQHVNVINIKKAA